MENWRSKNQMTAINSVAKENDPDKLARIAREAEDPLVRQAAANRRRLILDGAREAERGDKCPRCGAPLVDVEYYSAVQGASTVTNTRTDWATMKKTTTYSTPYTDLHRHTAVFCPHCANRKVNRIHKTSLVMLLAGVLLVLAGILPLFSDAAWGSLRFLLLGIGVVLAVAGYHIAGRVSMFAGARKGDPPITNSRLAADEDFHDYVSSLYIKMTPFEKIPRAEGTNAVLGRGTVRR